MNLIDCKQGTQDWFLARCGRITASEVRNAMAMLKSGKGETQARADYRAKIIAERLTGQVDSFGYVNDYMRRGTEEEPYARAEYEVETGADVEQVGFIIHPTMPFAGCSPDGLVGNDGLIEIKNPATKTHLDYLLSESLPTEYEPQVMFQIDCAEREWCDFISRDGRLPEIIRTFKIRVYRNDARIAEIRQAVSLFNEEIEAQIAALKAKYGAFELPQPKAPATEEANDAYLTDEDLKYIS